MINNIILLISTNWKEFEVGGRAGANIWGLEHLVYEEKLTSWGLFILRERKLSGGPTAAATIRTEVIKVEPGSSLLQQSCEDHNKVVRNRQDHQRLLYLVALVFS